MSNQERIDKMIDAILTLRGLGLEPTGFSMDVDMLEELTPIVAHEMFKKSIVEDKNGVIGMVNIIKEMENWNFTIMGIPIEPNFQCREIKAWRKEEKWDS